ncbi:hypothetical protein CFE53_00955 [Methanofervidicoccus sp. A16]|uniref:class I SAM-dependent methyltransferase n=1 Tax=Methanofervidicoccus sp. A16 TaxID=2607662 RepID=UPI00118B53E5|nr:class I SAM-dependent methyltransferase [Methanofervidicoccus sp. A16]AXI24806.1 hypothetical protein CFE53_00955 [Methanofervidicoccus sp. A16]
MKIEKLKNCIVCNSNKIINIEEESNLCMCKNCGHFFINPRPTMEEIANYYSRIDKYDTWIVNESAREVLWIRRLKLLKKIKQHGRLLDVGTGIGQFLYLCRHDFEVYGTEISKSAIRIAKERYNLDILYGELENIDFKNLKFDIITLFHVLEHVPDPVSTMLSVKKLLSEDGIVVIAIPNEIEGIRWRIGRFIKSLVFNKKFSRYGIPKITLDDTQGEVHLSYFTRKSIKYLLERTGFEIIEDTLDPYYVVNGRIKFILHTLYYYICLIIKNLLNVNVYDTMWIVAKVKK